MIPDCDRDRKGFDPLVGCSSGIVIIQAAIRRIPAVHCILGSLIGRGVWRQVDLTVGYDVERAGLIHHARYGFREARVADTVQNDSAYGDLAGIRLSPASP